MSDTAGTGTTEGTPQGGTEETGSTTETPTVEDLLAQVEEWKGHARKHEERAKANKDAAERLTEIEREKMSDSERASADLTAANTRATEAEDRATAAEAALARYKVATEFGLSADDAEALSSISDETALRALAERLAGRSTGTRPNPAQGKRDTSKPASPAEAFADALNGLI